MIDWPGLVVLTLIWIVLTVAATVVAWRSGRGWGRDEAHRLTESLLARMPRSIGLRALVKRMRADDWTPFAAVEALHPPVNLTPPNVSEFDAH